MKKKLIASVLLVAAAFYVCVHSTRAEKKVTDGPAKRSADSRQLADKEVARFEFYFSDRERMLKLRPMPVLRFAHQINGENYTSLFVWTYQGRPEAIASISNWYAPRTYHGLAVTSLATEKLIGKRDGKDIWYPRSAGVEFKPIRDADAPSESAVLRLKQMRMLARQFTGEFKRIPNDPQGGKLRLLSTPLYRYQSEDSRVSDGAIFGFVYGTAPQLILLIEARQTATGLRWEYALAPRNSTEYRVQYKGREVWRLAQLAPPWPNSKDPTNTYTVFPDLQREGRTQDFVDKLLKVDGLD